MSHPTISRAAPTNYTSSAAVNPDTNWTIGSRQKTTYGSVSRWNDAANPAQRKLTAQVEGMATRTYSSSGRQFVVTLVGTPAGSYSSWTVEGVRDVTTGDVVPVPGLQNIVASDEDAAFARVCDRIDGWLRLKP